MMKSLSAVSRVVADYLNRKSIDRMVLKSTLDELTSRLPETAIFGGMLRDISLGGVRNFSSDIDLVSYSGRREIFNAIKKYSPVENKFGGFRFIVAKQVFDIWSFRDTWAFCQGVVDGAEFQDLFKTTFFNVDATIFNLNKKEFLFSNLCEEGIRKKVLDLNMEENPYPSRMVRRAIKMSVEKNLEIGPKLGRFMLVNADRGELTWMEELFMNGLERHLGANESDSYYFKPQLSLIN